MHRRDRDDHRVDLLHVDGREVRDHCHHGDEQAHIAHSVHDEGLLCSNRIGGNVVPETDEEVRGQAHAFPADEETRVGVRQNQDEHRGDEEVEVGEEATTIRVVLHVRDRVDVDERPNEGDQHDEGHRQRVEHQSEVNGEVSRGNPREQGKRDSLSLSGEGEHCDDNRHAHREGGPRCHGCQQVTPAVAAASQHKKNRTGGSWNCDHQPSPGEDSRSLDWSCGLGHSIQQCKGHSGLLLSSSEDRGRQRWW